MSGMKSGRQHNKGGNYHAKNQNKQSSSKALQKDRYRKTEKK